MRLRSKRGDPEPPIWAPKAGATVFWYATQTWAIGAARDRAECVPKSLEGRRGRPRESQAAPSRLMLRSGLVVR
jgi:hypothetical protein